MVTRTISSNDAKQNWGSVMADATNDPESAVIVESHGKPKAVVISIERFQKLRDLELKEKQDRALAYLRQIEANYDGRNDDLSEEEINDLAVEIGREINRAAAERHRQTIEDSRPS